MDNRELRRKILRDIQKDIKRLKKFKIDTYETIFGCLVNTYHYDPLHAHKIIKDMGYREGVKSPSTCEAQPPSTQTPCTPES